MLLIQIIIGVWVAKAIPLCMRLCLFIIVKWYVSVKVFPRHYYTLNVPGYTNYQKPDGLVIWSKMKMGNPDDTPKYLNDSIKDGQVILGPWWFITPKGFKEKIFA